MVFALLRASSEAPVLPEHTKHLSFEIDYSGDALETDESNPNPSQAFKKLASRCPNLCVVQNRRPEPVVTSIQMYFHLFIFTKGSCNTLSHRAKLLILEHPCPTTYKASPSDYCTSSTLREYAGYLFDYYVRGTQEPINSAARFLR